MKIRFFSMKIMLINNHFLVKAMRFQLHKNMLTVISLQFGSVLHYRQDPHSAYSKFTLWYKKKKNGLNSR